ncbi:T9SS type B sorting domain-containing protein [Belliella kenyensis]|nr:gliding motility-associated C-terminal domain-containing protein [Belliella kenyensis]MDN3603817.1 gliding motility-associated C-terminal domain-containing protein [Belliella kenyensis]
MSNIINPCYFLSAGSYGSSHFSQINYPDGHSIGSFTLTGKVVEINRDASIQIGLPNVPVILLPQGGELDHGLITKTDPNGNYYFEGLEKGVYLVKIHDIQLNSSKNLYAVDGSERTFTMFKDSEICQNFEYAKYEGGIVGGLIWYDLNGDGRPNEWFDANGDGELTKNTLGTKPMPINEWEWIDFNGDGSYEGVENAGEIRMAGISNSENENISISDPQGNQFTVSTDVLGYYSLKTQGKGSYQVSFEMDEYMELKAELIGNAGKVAVLNNFVLDRMIGDPMISCGLTTTNQRRLNLTGENLRNLRTDFGLRCFEVEPVSELHAIDDELGEVSFLFGGMIGNILENDLLDGHRVTMKEVDFTFTELDNIVGLLISPNGELSLVPGVNEAREYRLKYTLSEVANPSNTDEAFVSFKILNEQVDLRVTKTSFGVDIYEGDEFEYEIVLSNEGGGKATNVILTDDLPPGISYVSSSALPSDPEIHTTSSFISSKLSWQIPEFPPGASLTIRLLVRSIEQMLKNPYTITNRVSVISDSEDVSPEDNFDTDVNTIIPFFIPNVITPNEDQKNDSFKIKGLGKFAENEIKILNRYGDQVFEQRDYQNDWQADKLPAGIYFYVLRGIEAGGEFREFKGWVQVVK